jgi:hypothetical protein
MGEEVDLSKLDVGESPAPTPAMKKSDNKAMIKQIKDLIRQGHAHRDISKSLRAMGFTYIDIEKMLAQADAEIYDATHKSFDYRTAVVIGAAVVLVIAAFAVLGGLLETGAADCGDDTFCSNKLVYCKEGLYKSSYSGVTHEYDIRREPNACRLSETVVSSSSLLESPGMSMVCVYPFSNGIVDTSDRYGPCTGSLADAYK